MGMVFGKIKVATPKFQVLKSTGDYEIREYSPSVSAEITYDPAELKGDKDGGFSILANYIGVLGKPQNTAAEKIAMTSPVISSTTKAKAEKIDMTTPVVTQEKGEKVTMKFILPEKYKKVEEAPKPMDERVIIKEEEVKKYGVVVFSGVANDKVVKGKVDKLKNDLERDGFKIAGEFLLGRYNPPWITLPPFRTNEIMIPVE